MSHMSLMAPLVCDMCVSGWGPNFAHKLVWSGVQQIWVGGQKNVAVEGGTVYGDKNLGVNKYHLSDKF